MNVLDLICTKINDLVSTFNSTALTALICSGELCLPINENLNNLQMTVFHSPRKERKLKLIN